MSRILGVLLSCAMLMWVGCGGSSTPAPIPTPTPATLVTVTPATATVPIGGSQIFTSVVGVTWSVNGPGSINANGVYLAPSTFPAPNTVTVTATLGTQTGSATGTIVYPNDNQGNESAPIKLGSSGGNILDDSTDGKTCCIGTLGSLINRGGTFFILSNNHVLARSTKGVAGEAIDQPGELNCPPGSQGLNVAALSEKAALQPATSGGPAPSNVDAAIAQIVAGMVDTSGAILDLGAAGATSIGALPPSSTPVTAADAFQNHPNVAKSGRTTGLTCSTLQSVLTDGVTVPYDQSCTGPQAFVARFDGQLVINGGVFSANGDSGSLIVTADTAQPVGLLYGGNPTSTVANTILDTSDTSGVHSGVLTAFNNGTAPTIVGGANHAVSCEPTAQASSAQVSAQSTPLSARQQQITAAVRDRHVQNLMASESAIRSVKVGSSSDSPSEGALLIELSSIPKNRIPAVIEGVRIKVIYSATMAMPAFTSEEFNRGVNAKGNHRSQYVEQPGLQGIGVGRSDDAPGEAAIVIYTIQGMNHIPIPATIDGVRTKVVDGEPFRAAHWNPKLEPKTGACGKPIPKAEIKTTLK